MSEGRLYTGSSSYFTRPTTLQLARVVRSLNPEDVCVNELQQFLIEVGFSTIFPNFDGIRIDTVHPFALLLAADVAGNDLQINPFPSITIADSQENDGSADTLGMEYEELALSRDDVYVLKNAHERKQVFMSDLTLENITREVDKGRVIMARKYEVNERHTLDFNIWTENKEVTSFLYDAVKQFLLAKRLSLKTQFDIELHGDVTGHRSGDVNVDFGRLLYGANVSAPATISLYTLEIDLPIGIISTINIYPHYHIIGGY